jgi:HTH-type transcriptional regulator/antitoxin HipB
MVRWNPGNLNIMKKKSALKSLDQFVDEQYGERGTPRREKFEKGYQEFKLGALIHEARLEKGLTQEELAERCGTNKGYISKVENNIKDVRLSTLQKIIEVGLGGKMHLSIKL